MSVKRFTPGEDGRFHCTEPAIDGPGQCDYSSALPQHLGTHLFHKHGIQGDPRNRTRRGSPPTAVNGGQRRGRPPKTRPMLSAEEVCSAALEAIAPNGSIPINAIPAYNTWVEQTQAFFTYLLG